MTHLRPKLIIGVAVAVVAFIFLSLAQEMSRRWQVDREYQRLQEEAQQAERKAIELEQLNQYFRTDDFQERLAREKLDFRAPGEHVVLIPEEEAPSEELQSASVSTEQQISTPRRWWNTFFVDPQPFYQSSNT